MDIKTILVLLDESPRRRERLGLAFGLARAFGAHLTARFALSTSPLPMYALAEAGAFAIEQEMQEHEAAAAEARRELAAEGAASPGVTTEWRDAGIPLRDDSAGAARSADLVVAGQPERGAARQRLVAGDLLLSAGRPILFVPYAGRFASLGRKALVAWNDSREAARAVADALPLLRRAEAVHVLAFDTGAAARFTSGADIGAYLERHGVRATFGREPAADIAVGELLLSRAADLDAGLIVMGGYGHSRVREQVLGGATRTLLESMTVPVLMSH